MLFKYPISAGTGNQQVFSYFLFNEFCKIQKPKSNPQNVFLEKGVLIASLLKSHFDMGVLFSWVFWVF